MQVSANASPDVSAYSGGSTLGMGSSSDELQNEFLKLMVAQIQNQDPLNPTDSTEYINQLATLTQVQSTENLVALSQVNQILLDNLQVLSTTNLVGTTVDVKTDTVVVSEGESYEGKIELEASSSSVILELVGADGKKVEINLGPQESGFVEFEFDAADLGIEGEYTMNVVLDEGQNYTPRTYIRGEVESVNISSADGSMTVSIAGVGDKPIFEIGRFG
ncbi:flagellar hook capping FlgD N-terminal domain-containing protein [Vibrio mediterranei]|uniref:flagellar hook capping FlgD N-terminal domain-containing protein n=1 Tax=Vibrio mediterranei TaxID=689 RepID=UPI004068463D